MKTAMTASRVGGRAVEFSPDPHPTLWGGGMSSSIPGNECVLKMYKPVSLTFHLHVKLGNRIVLRALGLLQKILARNPIQNAVLHLLTAKLMHYSG